MRERERERERMRGRLWQRERGRVWEMGGERMREREFAIFCQKNSTGFFGVLKAFEASNVKKRRKKKAKEGRNRIRKINVSRNG